MINSLNPKIVVLPSFYPMNFNYVRGGFFEEQTRLIKNRATDVTVIFNEDRSITSFNLKKLKYVYFQKQFKVEEGVPVLRKLNWNIIPTKFNFGRRIWIKNSINLVESFIKQYGKPDLFHVHCAFNAGFVAKFLKEKYNIPYILTEHSTFFALSNVSIAQKKEAHDIYSNAEKVIVVSNPFRKLLSEKIGFDINKIDVIPNFIDTDYFDPNFKSDPSPLEDMKTIFTVCHHGYKKRLDRLLDAYKIVLEHYPDWKLIIGGNGSETNVLKAKTKKLNLQDQVAFVGFLTKSQVKSYMKKANIFVLPSDVETFGVVVIEAMAMGLPVVATASGGPEDIITKETGIVTEKETESLAEGIIEIIANYNIYNKEYLRLYIINNFSGKSVADKYIKIYKDSILNYLYK